MVKVGVILCQWLRYYLALLPIISKNLENLKLYLWVAK
uniref:Uncharacterized protein n=1 Tax=Rhizophora mucronata TaxID=61149 RepID=A0A2P2L6I4_RHIMU